MTEHITITLAQLNPTVGDINGNIDKIRNTYKEYKDTSDIIIFAEMIVSGYPTDDLVLKPFFIDKIMKALDQFAKETKGSDVGLLVSTPWRDNGNIYNTVLLIHNGEIKEKRFKHNLPNYGVFDEVRVFTAGELPLPIEFKGSKLGIMTCEDMWFPEVTEHLKKHGAEILLTPNGSPYAVGKTNIRIKHAQKRVTESGLPLIYVNQVGGQDELVFDGASFALDNNGKVLTQLPVHEEYISKMIWERDADKKWICKSCEATHNEYSGIEAIYQSLVLGLRDYVNKNDFKGVLFGMSGGVDSALCAAIAVDALGADRIKCFMMPSSYTSSESVADAQECSELLGINHGVVSIKPAIDAFGSMFKDTTGEDVSGIAAENIQARSRGLFLMAMSNSTGYMVLSTGNKSEMSVGYATLYGDMCGGFNPLKDVYKMTVFELCEWRNKNYPKNSLGPNGQVIPDNIITKPPSAELKPDQKDEDSLPPYEVLDDILYCLIENEMSIEDITSRGHSREVVNRIWQLLDRAEYKRRQACPGVKITSKAFGRDRRYPIVNKFTDIALK